MSTFSMPLRTALAPIAAMASLMALPAMAQDRVLQFELGVGAQVTPTYEGSDDYKTGPSFGGGLDALTFGSINIEPGDGLGFGFGPSFRVLSARTDDDNSVLRGVDDVDLAVEIGAKLSYNWEGAEAFAALRRGVTGHDGLVLDLGADAIIAPTSRTELRIGPRLSFANDAYMDTYFSVPTGAASLAAYDADGGIKSYGIAMSLRYDMTQNWSIEGSLGYDRLSGSVEDSPIVKAGSRDQGTVGIMLIRKFDFRF